VVNYQVTIINNQPILTKTGEILSSSL